MPKFRKKPVVIEAEKYDGSEESVVKILMLGGQRSIRCECGQILIETLEGKMRADVGDWIIKGVNGEQYPCKPDIFEKTYEPIEKE